MIKKLSTILQDLPASEKRITLSTALTIARIILIPIIVGSMVMQQWGLAFWLLVIAAITDVLDGWLARWLNEQTFLGACLDPIADKILIISCFATLAFVQSPLFSIPVWFVLLVLVKELLLVTGAVVVLMTRGSLKVEPTLLGKAGMVAQTSFIIWLFACYFFHWLPVKTYAVMLGLVATLVILSLIHYAYIGLVRRPS